MVGHVLNFPKINIKSKAKNLHNLSSLKQF